MLFIADDIFVRALIRIGIVYAEGGFARSDIGIAAVAFVDAMRLIHCHHILPCRFADKGVVVKPLYLLLAVVEDVVAIVCTLHYVWPLPFVMPVAKGAELLYLAIVRGVVGNEDGRLHIRLANDPVTDDVHVPDGICQVCLHYAGRYML